MLTGRLIADQQRAEPVVGADAPDRARRRAADPQGRRHGHAHDGRAVRHRPDHRRGAGQRPRARGAGLPLFLRHAGRGRGHRRAGRATCAPTRRRSTPSARPRAAAASTKARASRSSCRRCIRATAAPSIERVHGRAAAARCRTLARAGAPLRHRPQHRCRGSRPAGALARPAGAPLLRARAGRLERHRLRGAGLPEARARS